MNFSDILASSIHDIKNSLSMIINAAEMLADDDAIKATHADKASALEHEARRVNNCMIQLLSLYKFDSGRQSIRIDECNLDDCLQELVAENAHSAQSNGVHIECECDDFLNGYFDLDLVRGVLNSSIGNAERYANSRVRLSGSIEEGYTVFRIEDDGDGFSEDMIEINDTLNDGDSFASARTNLGLFFAKRVAESHEAGERRGYIRLRNQVGMSGGCFEMWLP